MGFLGWLFKGNQPQGSTNSKQSSGASTSGANESAFPELPEASEQVEKPHVITFGDFVGECAYSANGRYRLVWRDTDDNYSNFGHRRSGAGGYILLEGNNILLKGRVARPNDGKVANNGTFILNDWGFGDALKGTFLAFDKSGKSLLTKKFKANLFNNGLSADGHYAVCQTCGTDYEAHNERLFLFDLDTGANLENWAPETGRAFDYEFSQPGIIRLVYRNLGGFRFTYKGESLDQAAYADAMLLHGDAADALEFIHRMVRTTSGELQGQWAEKILKGTRRVLSVLPPADEARMASAYRYQGQCLEGLGNQEAALASYDKALALKPGIGIKGRADKLRKGLAQKS